MELLDEDAGDDVSLARVGEELLAAVQRLSGGSVVVQGEIKPPTLVNVLCQELELPALEKLDLLACDSVASRARRLMDLLAFHKLERESGRSAPLN